MELHNLAEVRHLLDEMAEWRLFGPLNGVDTARYERLCEYEQKILDEQPHVVSQ
ncbi:MAG TPA: hypothetical protein VFH56_09810 [Acidimicrobiales bacterium]|nr:hypothetical protein [Acidimicrobiales bacterium]